MIFIGIVLYSLLGDFGPEWFGKAPNGPIMGDKFQWLTPHAADPYIFLVVVCRSRMSMTGTVCFVVPFVRPL